MFDLTTTFNATKHNTAFSTLMPGLQLAWDSVSRGALKTCPRYYYYTIILGYQTKSENIHFIFGIGFHSSIELYHREKVKGKDHPAALISATRFAIEYTWDSKRNRPWISDEPTKTRQTLIRSVIWYLEQFKDDVYKVVEIEDKDGNISPAVELSFHYDSGLISLTDEPYIHCGHLDRFVQKDDRYYIPDVKTTKFSLTKNTQDFFNKYSPDDQMTGYYAAGNVIFQHKIDSIIIDAGQTAVNFSRFQRGFIYRTPEQLNEWLIDLDFKFKENEIYVKENYWPMNDKSCNMWGGCPFRLVCSETPSMRQNLLDNFFIKRIWDPLITREV